MFCWATEVNPWTGFTSAPMDSEAEHRATVHS